jgi:hypothetical protein
MSELSVLQAAMLEPWTRDRVHSDSSLFSSIDEMSGTSFNVDMSFMDTITPYGPPGNGMNAMNGVDLTLVSPDWSLPDAATELPPLDMSTLDWLTLDMQVLENLDLSGDSDSAAASPAQYPATPDLTSLQTPPDSDTLFDEPLLGDDELLAQFLNHF